MKKYIISLDQGTTSSRAIIFDRNHEVIATAQSEFTQIYPHPGWVEHDPMEIWSSQSSVLSEVIAKSGIHVSEIDAIGITNQRETTIVWDKTTGKPVYNAIVWQCRRTASLCNELKEKGVDTLITSKTGLVLDAYFSATKIQWILDNVEGARTRADNGELLFGTVDSWLIYKLTGGQVHVTDFTNASRTMLFNIHTLQWDQELLQEFSIPASMLPKVRNSSEVYGTTNIQGTMVPIAAAVGDQQSALFGQTCFESGEVKNTYGTGCFVLMNTKDKLVKSDHGLISTIAIGLNGTVEYALEGSVFVAGALIQWLRDELNILDESDDTEYFAGKVKDNGGVVIVPAFTGLGAPYWNMDVRGTIFGLTRGANKNHIMRAALEAIAYQSYDIIKAMENDSNIRLSALNVDGGASANNFLMQFQADILNIAINRPQTKETTALGACFLAGLATGFFASKEDLKHHAKGLRQWQPAMDESTRQQLLSDWHRAVRCTLSW